MRLKGALHVHSKLSHDGKLTIAELAGWYQSRGYNFVALGEHSQDMDAEKIARMKQECTEHSSGRFLMIPGLEYSCRGGIHLFALGSTMEISETDPVAVAQEARAKGAFVILAHPSRLKWNCPPDVLRAVNAAEFWNIGYDGKYLPSLGAPEAFRRMRRINPELLATGGQDFHRKPAFYDLCVYVEADARTQESILAAVHNGNYRVQSRFSRFMPDGQFTALHGFLHMVLGWPLAAARKVREILSASSS